MHGLLEHGHEVAARGCGNTWCTGKQRACRVRGKHCGTLPAEHQHDASATLLGDGLDGKRHLHVHPAVLLRHEGPQLHHQQLDTHLKRNVRAFLRCVVRVPDDADVQCTGRRGLALQASQ